MNDDPYMNGCGVTSRTNELNNAMFRAIDKAVIGDIIAFVAAMAFLAAFVLSSILLAASCFPMVYISWFLRKQWKDAKKAVAEHRANIEAETAKRGKGWAKS